jgi:hypothetical protein
MLKISVCLNFLNNRYFAETDCYLYRTSECFLERLITKNLPFIRFELSLSTLTERTPDCLSLKSDV